MQSFVFCRYYRQLLVTYRAVDRLQAAVYDRDGNCCLLRWRW